MRQGYQSSYDYQDFAKRIQDYNRKMEKSHLPLPWLDTTGQYVPTVTDGSYYQGVPYAGNNWCTGNFLKLGSGTGTSGSGSSGSSGA